MDTKSFLNESGRSRSNLSIKGMFIKRISLTLLEPCFFKNIRARLSTANIFRHGSPSFEEIKSFAEHDSIFVKSTSGNERFSLKKI